MCLYLHDPSKKKKMKLKDKTVTSKCNSNFFSYLFLGTLQQLRIKKNNIKKLTGCFCIGFKILKHN